MNYKDFIQFKAGDLLENQLNRDQGAIAMIEICFSPNWTSKEKPLELFCLSEKPVKQSGSVDAPNFSVSVLEDRKSLIFRYASFTETCYFDFSKEVFCHFAIYIYSGNQISYIINGREEEEAVCTFGEAEKLKFAITHIRVGHIANEDCFDLAAFRIWQGQLRGKWLKKLIKWDSLKDVPSADNILSESSEVANSLMVYALSEPNPGIYAKYQNDMIFGLWVMDLTKATPRPKKVVIEEKPGTAHCLYEDQRYFSIGRNDDDVYLISDKGDCLKLIRYEDSLVFSDGNISWKLKIDFEKLVDENEGNNFEIMSEALILTEINDSVQHPAYRWVRPYVPPLAEEGTSWGSLFQTRAPNMDQMLSGVDITELNPFENSDAGIKQSSIFRYPPNSSRKVVVMQKFAVPFGMALNPNTSYHGKSTSKFVSDKKSLEEKTENGISFESKTEIGKSASVKVPEVGGGGYDVNFGFSSGTNEKVRKTLKDMFEKQKFYSYKTWESTSYDLILDKANLYFDNQPEPGDEVEAKHDNSGRFYTDLLLLKKKEIEGNGSNNMYIDFVAKYGTHFVAAATYGAKGEQRDTFKEEAIIHLISNGTTLGHKSGQSFAGKLMGSIMGMVESGLSMSHSEEKTDTRENDVSKELSDILKEETSEPNIWGSHSEGAVDDLGAIQIYRHFKSLADLLLPPFIEDYTLSVVCRPRLIEALDQYIQSKSSYIDMEDPCYFEIDFESSALAGSFPREYLDSHRKKYFHSSSTYYSFYYVKLPVFIREGFKRLAEKENLHVFDLMDREFGRYCNGGKFLDGLLFDDYFNCFVMNSPIMFIGRTFENFANDIIKEYFDTKLKSYEDALSETPLTLDIIYEVKYHDQIISGFISCGTESDHWTEPDSKIILKPILDHSSSVMSIRYLVKATPSIIYSPPMLSIDDKEVAGEQYSLREGINLNVKAIDFLNDEALIDVGGYFPVKPRIKKHTFSNLII